MNNYIVITTINALTESVEAFDAHNDWKQILVGDKKSVPINDAGGREFLGIDQQLTLGFNFTKLCPYNHYARKNIGYLYAMMNGASVIYDTDDDNCPLENWFLPKFESNRVIKSNHRVFNIYRCFTDKKVWPRGFPLESINDNTDYTLDEDSCDIAVWQGLANGEPDVDAIFRLVNGEKIVFDSHRPLAIQKGVYCPFNSQNTFWNNQVFPLLYLPVTVSFRYTDILRGFVAQKVFWGQNMHLGFTEATVYQDRNVHDLMKDFDQEVPMYTGFSMLNDALDRVVISGDLAEDMVNVYEELARVNIVSIEELDILRAWIKDCEKYMP